MSISISRAQRSALFFFSASGYIAWCCGLDGRLEAQIISAPPQTLSIAPQQHPPRVSSIIQRDPFLDEDDSPASLVSSKDGDSLVPAAVLADNGPDVPNITAFPALGGPQPDKLVLKATIVGSSPVAYVQEGGGMQIVRIGDVVGGHRVRHIDLQGLAFADGSHLDLPQDGYSAPQPVQSAAPSNTLVPSEGSAPSPTASLPSPPGEMATPGYPTPAPLPTVHQNGIPVGVNPTPDFNAPTAQPYPYPYPPKR